MNEAWIRIFKEYIACYEAIEKLEENNITTEAILNELREDLLYEIIEAMKSEVEE